MRGSATLMHLSEETGCFKVSSDVCSTVYTCLYCALCVFISGCKFIAFYLINRAC